MVSPHAKARGSVLEIDYPGVGPVKSANNPIKLSDAPGRDAAQVADGGRAHGRDHARSGL